MTEGEILDLYLNSTEGKPPMIEGLLGDIYVIKGVRKSNMLGTYKDWCSIVTYCRLDDMKGNQNVIPMEMLATEFGQFKEVTCD